MSGFNAFDISILGSVFASQFGYGPGSAAGSVAPNANRALSAAELAKLPPWDQRQPKVNQTQEVRKIMAARSILDPDAGRWKNARAGTESDIKKLFAVHRAMDRLQTLSEAANRNGISGSERKRLNDRFQKGLKELDDYMTGMKLSRADLIKGKRQDKLETKEFRSVTGVLQGSNLTTIGPHVAIQDFANAQPFSFTITTEATGPVEIAFDFAEMGDTVRSLDNVAAYMNGKLEQAGFDTRIRPEYRMDAATGQYGWGLNLVRATGEELTFDDGTPAGPVPGGNLIVNGDMSSFSNPLFVTIDGGNGQYDTLDGWTAWRNGQLQASPEFNLERARAGSDDLGLDTDNRGGQDAYSQTVQTEAGKAYTLSWDSWRNMAGTTAGTGDYEVLWNGQVVSVINADGDTSTRGYSVNVTGTGGQDTLMFRERGADDSYGSIIDNIRLQEAMVGPAPPPPLPPPPSGAAPGVDLLGGAGSFEEPNLTNTWQSYTSAVGWTASGASGTFGVIDGTALNGFGSTQGNQVVELQGRDLSRTVNTAAGQSYRLSFDFMRGDSGTQAEGAFQVLWNGQVVGNFSGQDTDWESAQLNVTGTGGADTLTFRRLDTTNPNNGAWLDNITLNTNPAPTGPNLVANGSFESNLTGWTQSGVGVVTDATRASDGTRTTILGSNNNGTGWSMSTAVSGTVAGQAYALEFDYGAFGNGANPEGGVRAIVRDAGGAIIGSRDFYDSTQQTSAPGIYQKARLDFTASGGNVTVEFQDINSGNSIADSMMLDNVSVRAIPGAPVSPPPPAPPPPSGVAQGTEILVNGSFNTYSNQILDYGQFSDVYQNVQGWTSTADVPWAGVNNGFEIVYATGSGRTNAIDLDMDVGAADTISQTVQTEAGRTYDLSFTFETTPQAITNGGNSAGFEVLWNGTVVGTYSPTSVNPQTVNLQVTGTGGQDALSFREIGNNDGYGAVLSEVSLRAGAPVTGPLGGNLASNGSFEADNIGSNSFQFTNVTGWTGITGPLAELHDQLVTPAAGNGQQYIELMNGGVRQSITTVAGQTYQLDFASRYGNDGTAQSNAFEVWYNGSKIADVNPVQGQPWQNNTFTFTGAGGPANLEFRMKSGQENGEGAFIDAVQVRQVMGAAPPPVNLIQNGSFEQLDSGTSWNFVDDALVGMSTPTGWTSSAGSQTNILRSGAGTYSSDGQNSLELDAELGVDSISQSVQTVAGQVYDLRFDTRLGPTTSPSTADMEVLWNGALVGTIRPGSQTFETMNFQVVGTGGNDTLTFRELAGQNNQKGAVIDNVRLTAAQATQPAGYGSELVTNGGFEANDIAANSFQFLNVTGWTGITGSQGEIQDATWAPQGSQVMELMNGGTRQSINTTAGKVYELNFASHRGWDGNAASHAFEVWYNGQMIADVAPQTGEGWKDNTFTFMGAGGPANLEFRMKPGQENAQGAMIDAVSVREVLPGSRPNLLRNGSFEADDQVAGGYTYLDAPIGWTASNPGVNEVADTWNGIAGTDGLQWIEFSSTTLSQSVTTQAGQAYTFSFDYRGGDAGTGDQQRFRVRVNGQLLDLVDANGVNSWNSESYTFIGTGNDTVQFERLSGGRDTGVWLDNVAVRAQGVSPPPPPPPAGPNIVTNGSFEADNVATGGYVYLTAPAGWTASNPNVNEVADTWNGIPGTNGPQWIEFSSNTLSQALTTQAGQNYTFSFDYRGGDEGSGDQQRFRVRVNGQLLEQVDANGLNSWASKSYSFTGTGTDTIQFERLSGGIDTGVWLDNVQVRAQLPPPPPAVAGSNIITNGSFEGTDVANNSSADVVQAGWSTVLGTNGNRVDTLDYNGAPDGEQYAELDQAGGYRTVVNTDAGRVYTLDFDFKNNANGSVADNQFEVWWNGQKVGDYAPGSGQDWTNSQLNLVGTGGAVALEFRTKTGTAGMSNFNGAHIDGIELRAGALPSSGNWGANMLVNGSFENYGGAGGWANNNTNMANTQVAGFSGQLTGWTGNSSGGTGSGGDLVRGNAGAPVGTDGNVVVELDGVGGPNVDGLSQTVQTTAGTQYRLQFDLSRYNNVGSGTSGVEVLWNGQVVGTATPSTTNGQWSTATFMVTGTGGANTLQLREVGSQNDGGGALIDNVRLQANLGAGPPPPPLGNNLVSNGSFEITPAPVADGNLANWASIQGWNTGPGDFMEVVNPLNGGGENASNGSYFLELDTDNATQTEISQVLATEAGKTYQISLDHKARLAYTGAATNGIEVLWNGQVVGDISATDWQNWTTSSFTVTASGNSSQLMFREKGGNGDGFGAHMDNVRVQERLDIPAAGPASADLASRTYGTSLIQDGGFEGLAVGVVSSLATSAWQTADGNTEVWAPGTLAGFPGNGSSAAQGNRFLELDQYGTQHNDLVPDEIWQDVQTEAGKIYQLDFNSMGRAGAGTLSNTMEVLWNGDVIGTVTSAADGTWDTSRFDVVGTGGMDRLTFRELAGGNDAVGPFIDNVRLREVTNAPVNDPTVGPDVLGLGSSNWEGGSRKIVDMTSARAGDEITIQVNDKRAATIRITDTMTMRDLAARLQREMGTAGTAKVVRGPKGERIDLDPKVANRVEILRSANMKTDALEDLGLFEGVARKIGTGRDSKRPTFVSGVVGGVTTRADGTDGVFRGARGINAKPIAAIEFSTDMRIDDKAEAKTATEDLEGMMRRVRLAYRRVNGELDQLGNGGMPAPKFSPREAARLAQYQRALTTIQQGPSTSLLLGGL